VVSIPKSFPCPRRSAGVGLSSMKEPPLNHHHDRFLLLGSAGFEPPVMHKLHGHGKRDVYYHQVSQFLEFILLYLGWWGSRLAETRRLGVQFGNIQTKQNQTPDLFIPLSWLAPHRKLHGPQQQPRIPWSAAPPPALLLFKIKAFSNCLL
jgi:hypothetical protein